MSDSPVISFRDVSFAYDASPILEDVNLTVTNCDLTCIVGPNGGGKTTLLRLMLGLLRPGKGEVRLFGEPPEKTRHRVGYMPQHVTLDPQFPVSVMDVVLMGRLGRRLGGAYTKADRKAAHDALQALELEAQTERLYAMLSGGQRQRVLIARALACEPDILILDEPTANMDTRVEAQLFDLLKAYNERMTILMVSHDLAVVSNVVRNVICVNRHVMVHPTSEITSQAIQDLYGGGVRLVRHDHSCAHEEHAHG